MVGRAARPRRNAAASLAAAFLIVALAPPARAWPVASVPTRVPAPPTGGSHDQARKAVREFLDALERGLGPTTLFTLRALSAHDQPVAAEILVELLAEGSPCLRPTARRVLAGFRAPETLAWLDDHGLGHKQGSVRAQVLDALVSGRPDGFDWLGRAVAALDDSDPRVRAVAVAGVGRARDPAHLATLVELAADPSERVRAAIPSALVRLVRTRAMPLLEQLATDGAWRVRLAVVRSLVEVKSRAGVELLVTMLGREPGRLREDAAAALVHLTARNYGQSVEAWQAFLDQAPDDFLAQADAGPGTPAEAPTQTVARYYGISTSSTRFVVITDLSTSMDYVDVGRYHDSGRSRLATTQIELTKLIEGLDPEVRFDLLTFSDGVDSWRGELVEADDRTRKAALRELGRYHSLGGTNVYAALERVFDQAEASIDASRRGPEAPDTVFLLTDGAPSAGELRDVELLEEYVAERNRSALLRFHCVALTKDEGALAFLSQIAEHSGGRSVSPLR